MTKKELKLWLLRDALDYLEVSGPYSYVCNAILRAGCVYATGDQTNWRFEEQVAGDCTHYRSVTVQLAATCVNELHDAIRNALDKKMTYEMWLATTHGILIADQEQHLLYESRIAWINYMIQAAELELGVRL